MANSSVGGLVSGLDTAGLISQLMQLEARPQTMLKSRVSTEQRAVTALQTLNSKLASIATKAADLAKSSSWSPLKATSSNDKLTVTAGASAQAGSVTLDVTNAATVSTAIYSTSLAATAEATTSTTLTVTPDATGTGTVITLTDKSLQGIANAINASDVGLRATLVRAGGDNTAPTYRLHVVSTETGAASGFTIDDDGDAATTFLGGLAAGSGDGVDAQLTIDGQPYTSASNTITGLMPGVDVTLAKDAIGTATITVAQDSQAMADKVKGLVDSLNAALSELGTLSASGADPKARGLLAGDSTLRTVRGQLLDAVVSGVGGASLASYGIQTDRTGKVVFDEAKFKTAYAADPAKVTEVFTSPTNGTAPSSTGFATRVEALAKRFSDSIDGVVTTTIKSRQSAIKGWEDDITDWDVRLASRKTALERQYTALESALGKLQSQSTWLAGQLAGLPSMSNGQ